MKTNRFTTFVTLAISLAGFSTVDGADQSATNGTTIPPATDAATPTVTAPAPGPGSTDPIVATINPNVASAQWSDIKDFSYEMRAQFFAGLKRLEAKADDQIRELNAKRATMKGTTETKGWDSAMEEMRNARSYLKSMREELSEATDETWNQGKDKIGQAWLRTQNAYGKVKSSTTS